MQHRIEHIEVRISRLKPLHIFTQALSRYLGIGSADRRVFSRSYVDKVFIETFVLVCTCDNALARQAVEQVFKVVTDLTILSFLISVIFLYRFIEKLMISVAQSLLNEHNIVRCSGAVDILGRELSVVM